MCRKWLVSASVYHSTLAVQISGKERLQQRYILCVLFYSTGGPSWNVTDISSSSYYLDPAAHECEWPGVRCGSEDNENGSTIDLLTVRVLVLFDANLRGTLPNELSSLKRIEYLRISGNPDLEGTIPEGLFLQPQKMVDMFHCDLSSNNLTGTVPSPSNTATALTHVYLHRNRLVGSIPFFGNQIEELYVNTNFFDNFPSDRYSMVDTLRELVAYENLLTGTLSSTSWRTGNLERFDVAVNDLSGPIPQSLWELPKLTHLHLDLNEFSGALPQQLASATSGRQFVNVWLETNALGGPIPASFGRGWENLTSLLLHENSFTGAIPCFNWDEGQFDRLEADCSLLCDCCTRCYPAK